VIVGVGVGVFVIVGVTVGVGVGVFVTVGEGQFVVTRVFRLVTPTDVLVLSNVILIPEVVPSRKVPQQSVYMW
jgi:hypothetical protein